MFIIAGTVFMASCTTAPICATASITPLQGKLVAENLGNAEGSDTAISILGLFMIGRPDIDRAITKAVSAKNGDTLINVRCYETSSYFILFSLTTVKVEGDAIKFAAADLKNTRRTK